MPGILPSAADRYFSARYPGHTLIDFDFSRPEGALLRLAPNSAPVCPKCGRPCRIHETRRVSIRDWDIMAGGPVTVEVPVRRVQCDCGHTGAEPRPAWVLPKHRITLRLAALCQRMLSLRVSNSDACRLLGVGWELAKDLDKARLETLFGDGSGEDLHGMRRIAIDEISIHKGHEYATIGMDLDDGRVFSVVEGKSSASVQEGLFDRLRDAGADKGIESVSVDMNAAFPGLVSRNLPQAKLAYDLFHVMKHYREDVLKKAKAHAMEKARAEWRAKPKKERTEEGRTEFRRQLRMVSGADWLVLRDPGALTESGRERLETLRRDNRLFADLYPLADMVRAIWRAPDRKTATGLLDEAAGVCRAIAQDHGFEAVRRFAGMLERRREGIVTSCLVGLGTNILEGANNKAKVIKRIAYGFRDFEYFALKLKGAFPGKRWLATHGTLGEWGVYWNETFASLAVPHLS